MKPDYPSATEHSSEHDKAVAYMFSRIVPWYDRLNTLLSLGIDRLWRRRLVREVRLLSTRRVLDIAAGTLDVSITVHTAHQSALIFALDFCPPMLIHGKQKLLKQKLQNHIFPMAGDAKFLPIPDNSVDCITMAFGIRNVLPRHEAFEEMMRVLVPGGRACILEFGSGKQHIWGGVYNFYLNKLLPQVGRIFSKDKKAYDYLAQSICAFPTAVELEEEMREAGFACAWHIPLSSGIVCLHVAEKAR